MDEAERKRLARIEAQRSIRIEQEILRLKQEREEAQREEDEGEGEGEEEGVEEEKGEIEGK